MANWYRCPIWFLAVAFAFCAFVSAQSRQSKPRYTIAFKSFAPNNTDIFVANPDGSHERPLLPNAALDYNASFSPDGQWVVFTSHRSGFADLYRAHRDGSGFERLTNDPAFDDQGVLSPDGKALAFVSSRSGQADIWILDLATRRLRNLTHHPSGDFRPAWSPDGQWIAFSSDRDPVRTACPPTTEPGPAAFVTPQYTAIYIVHQDGSALQRITGQAETAGTPRWSPDGSRLAFYVGDVDQVCRGGLIFGTGTTQIVSIDVKSGSRTTLTSGSGVKVFPRWVSATQVAFQTADGIRFTDRAMELQGEFQAPDWSADHSTMIFQRETDHRGDRDRDFQSWRSSDPLFGLLRVPDVSSFAPAADRLVYMLTNFSGPIRNGALMIANADGSGRHVIYEGPLTEDATGPAWSPSGDAILFGLGGFFQRAPIKSAQVMSIHPDGTGLTALTQSDVNNGMPSWSADGKQVVYRVVQGTTRQLYILDVGTKKSRRIETGSNYGTFPTWSPRGDWIAFTSKRDDDYEIYRIRPDGTGLQRLTHSRGNDAHPAFSPDGEWIAFSTARSGFKDEAVQLLLSATFQPYGEIAVMRANGSDVRILTDNSTEEGTPSWVPNQKR